MSYWVKVIHSWSFTFERWRTTLQLLGEKKDLWPFLQFTTSTSVLLPLLGSTKDGKPSPPFSMEFTCHYKHSFIQQVFTEHFLCIRHSSGLLTYLNKQSRPRSIPPLSPWNLHSSGIAIEEISNSVQIVLVLGTFLWLYSYIQSRSNPRLSPREQEGRRNISLKNTEQKG